MKALPAIGTRVIYRRRASEHIEARTCTGVVEKIYRGGEWHKDPETGERYQMPDHAAVKVDAIPAWWPYPGTDRFAPSVDELQPA